MVFFAFGLPWSFRIATIVFALAEIEEIAITAVLPRWHADVRSIVHARRLARDDQVEAVRRSCAPVRTDAEVGEH